MNIVIADKSKEYNIFHPILLLDLKNQPSKKLTLPQGSDDQIANQIFFTDEDIEPNLEHDKIFYSDEYFFIALFNTTTFDDHIDAIINLINQNSHSNTIAYLIKRFVQIQFPQKDINIEKYIELYRTYDKKYKNEEKTYAFYYDVVKKLHVKKI